MEHTWKTQIIHFLSDCMSWKEGGMGCVNLLFPWTLSLQASRNMSSILSVRIILTLRCLPRSIILLNNTQGAASLNWFDHKTTDTQGREWWTSKLGGGENFTEILLKLHPEACIGIFQVDKSTGIVAWLSITVWKTGFLKKCLWSLR